MTLAVLIPIIVKIIEALAVGVIAPLAASYILKNIDKVKDERLRDMALVAVQAAEELKSSGQIEPDAALGYAASTLRTIFPVIDKGTAETVIHAALIEAGLGSYWKNK